MVKQVFNVNKKIKDLKEIPFTDTVNLETVLEICYVYRPQPTAPT